MKYRILFALSVVLFIFVSTTNAAQSLVPGKKAVTEIQKIKPAGKEILTLPADLRIFDASMTPAHPKAGRTITFTARIHNSGHTQAPASKALIRVGGETNGLTVQVPALNQNEDFIIQRQIALSTVQNYSARFIADSENDVKERIETNNSAILKFHVRNEEISARFNEINFDPNQGTQGKWWVSVENTGTEPIGLHIVASYPDAGGMFYDVVSLPSEEIHTTSPPKDWFSARPVQQIKFKLVRRVGPNHYTEILDEKILTINP